MAYIPTLPDYYVINYDAFNDVVMAPASGRVRHSEIISRNLQYQSLQPHVTVKKTSLSL